jgi:hypothetical protein
MARIVAIMFILCKFFFSAIPHYSLGFLRCLSVCGWADADGLPEYELPEVCATSISAASSGGIGMLLNGGTLVPPVFPWGTKPIAVPMPAPTILSI